MALETTIVKHSKPKIQIGRSGKILIIFQFLLSSITTACFISSCTTKPSEILDTKINIDIRNQNKISEQQWNDLVNYIDSNKTSFPKLLGQTGRIDSKKLTDRIIELSSQRRNSEPPEIYNPESKNENAIKPIIKVFIENSISMDGYVKGNTDFKSDLTEMLVDAKNYVGESNIEINFINSHILPSSNKDISTFASKLDPNSTTYNVGGKGRGTSNINDIFRMILDSLHKNEIVVLSSDCIYSLGKGQDSQGKLNYQKSLTHDAFNDALKKFDLETICLKMKSDFNGDYYDLNDHPTSISNERPYYFWLIGEKKILNEYTLKLIRDMKGIVSSYSLSSNANEKQPYYTVLKETNKIGSFRQTDRSQLAVKNIEDIKYDNGQLQFAIAIDLSNIPVDSGYLKDVKNYKVTDGFIVRSVEEINKNKLSQRDRLILEKTPATHIITISTTDKYSIQNLKIELSNQIPHWVFDSNSTNDVDIKNQLDKTFGFAFLVGGVSEAYSTQYPEQKSYFTVTVLINKDKKGSSPLSTLLVTVFLIAIVIFIILIILKRKSQN